MIHQGFLRVLKGQWGLELGFPYNSAGYRAMIEEMAENLQRLPIHARDETGNPTWHGGQVQRMIPKIIEKVIEVEEGLDAPKPGPAPIRSPLIPAKIIGEMTPVDPQIGSKEGVAALLPIVNLVGDKIRKEIAKPVLPPMIELPPATYPEPVILPKPKVPGDLKDQYVGWRRDCLVMLQNIDPYVPYSRALTFPSPFFANALTESGIKNGVYPNDTSKTVSHPDGYYKEWGRDAWSTGVFQIREPTAYYLFKNRMKIGSENAAMLPRLPQDPKNNREAVIAALREYPGQLYYGGVLYALAMRWMNSSFTFENDMIAEIADKRDAKLQEFVNSRVTNATPAWSCLLRLYWNASSKGGPRSLVRSGAAVRVLERRFIPYAKSEYDRYVTLTRRQA
jgi:hypothetical protein